MILPSKQYEEYEVSAAKYIKAPAEPISKPVNVRCLYYMQNARACDLTNLLEATHDILVKHKVLLDDNSKVIYAVDGSRVFIDKLTPRTEVFIEEIAE
jgi:Holliday junction resolvase RusA-like endonuclease